MAFYIAVNVYFSETKLFSAIDLSSLFPAPLILTAVFCACCLKVYSRSKVTLKIFTVGLKVPGPM